MSLSSVRAAGLWANDSTPSRRGSGGRRQHSQRWRPRPMNLGTTQFGFSLFLRLQPDSRPSTTPRAWMKACAIRTLTTTTTIPWSCCRDRCCRCELGGRPSTVHSTPPSTVYQSIGREDGLRTGSPSRYCGSSKQLIGTSSRLGSLPCAMRQLRCAKIFVWPIWPRAMTKSQLTRGKIGVSTHPGSVVIHVHDEDGVRTRAGGPRRLKINLSLMTGHATCV